MIRINLLYMQLTHPSLVLDFNPEELDRLGSQESLARVGESSSRSIHCHLTHV